MPRPKTPAAPALELREACIVAAQEVIAERGIEDLSLREVARRLGVSHQAPYRHYPSRDHLLAEVLRRCFQGFAAHLDARPPPDDPHQDLHALGLQYLSYAREHPLEYRLMFSTAWPQSLREMDFAHDATRAFDILRDVLRRLHGDGAAMRQKVELDALYIWSTMHGLAGVMNGPCLPIVQLHRNVPGKAVEHAMQRMGAGLFGPQ